MQIFRKSLLLTAALALTACGSSAATTAPAAESAAGSTAEAASGDLLSEIRAKGTITVAMEGTWAPWTYHDENDNLVGYDVEVATEIAKKLGVEPQFVEGEWDGLLAGLDAGRYDIMVNGVDITPERAEKYDFSDPYYYEARRVVVRADDDSINGPEDLNGKKIATNTTNAFIPWYEENGAEVVGIDTSAEAIDLVLSGRADFLGISVPVLNAYLDEHPDAADKLRAAFVIPNSEDVIAIPVRKGEPEFLDAINAALAELREEGTLKEISEKYLGGDYTNSAYSN